uniref:Oxidoreductase spdH n=1 Tax=Cordana terrestris TaxID=1293529 RepID=SPDH_CORTS|nr:putative GMC oxidoreductase [Cordana terrestris]
MKLFILLSLTLSAGRTGAEIFDYVIVGAGTAGLVIANRLSEDPSNTVAVIEPGTDQRTNPNVTDWSRFTQAFGTSIDWQYQTVKQSGADGRVLDLHQGKAWGGTSTINGMAYIRGDLAQFDAWEGLGNPGWNWESLFPYYKKSEMYTVPSDTQLAAGATYEPQYHGFNGHVHTGYPSALMNGSFASPIIQTWEGLSLPHNPDLNSGSVRGFSMGPQTLDRALDVRWDSARAYYYPVGTRSNLRIIKGTVKRINWSSKEHKRSGCSNSLLVADEVEFLDDNGDSQIVGVRKEVIVSAGAVRTPLVLEYSGIGNPRILEGLGIQTRVDLPGVGENLQEQPNHVLAYIGSTELGSSASAYHTFISLRDLFGDDIDQLQESTGAKLSSWAQAAVEASGNGALNVTAVTKLLRVQHNLLFKQNVTAAEIITAVAPTGGGLLASNFWILLPFSRGSVHLGSIDQINKPVIDPRFFLAEFDLDATIALGKYAQKFWFSEPIASSVIGPLIPGADILPNNATSAQWETYIRSTVGVNSHPLGTAAMMSRELGGVVDPQLKVYGTANVRVVDASVFPTQFSGHLTATIYAVAERAADIIKQAI